LVVINIISVIHKLRMDGS